MVWPHRDVEWVDQLRKWEFLDDSIRGDTTDVGFFRKPKRAVRPNRNPCRKLTVHVTKSRYNSCGSDPSNPVISGKPQSATRSWDNPPTSPAASAGEPWFRIFLDCSCSGHTTD